MNKDIPILFSAPMVRAILRETEEPGTGKTETRRGLRPFRPKIESASGVPSDIIVNPQGSFHPARFAAGDRLWVRETHWRFGRWLATKKAGKVSHAFDPTDRPDDFLYAADREPPASDRGKFGQPDPAWHLRPAIFMERRFSRLTLAVEAVKVERLQDISEQDCEREGCMWDGRTRIWRVPWTTTSGGAPIMGTDARQCFANLWQAVNGPGSWDDNPWVAAVRFRPALRNIDEADREHP